MNKLIVLAFNEEQGIQQTIENLVDDFDEIIVVNDKSSDNTLTVLQNLSIEFESIKIISNKKNMGPGKSMEIGMKAALETPFRFVVKVDGDNQFDTNDVKDLLNLAAENKSDFIKCDRFWVGGVEGEIPKIRYFGNSFASLLIKMVTGNWRLNDPLNGLFLFSYEISKLFRIPKFFNRYGYPFFINAYISKIGIENELNLHQYKNKITYGNETSKLNPITVFLKLILFSLFHFFSTIKTKLKYSSHQLSALIDIFALLAFVFSIFSLSMTLATRFFGYEGNQGAWSLLFVILFITFFVLIFQTQKILRKVNDRYFTYLN